MDIEQQLEKARIWAYWGFIGLAMPIAGIIASVISSSILDRLLIAEDDSDVIEEHARITQTAHTAKILSIIMLIIMIIGVIFYINTYVEAAAKANEAQETYNKALQNYKDGL